MSAIPSEATDYFHPRILSAIPAGLLTSQEEVLHASQVVTTIAVWFGTNVGYPFMEQLLDGLDPKLPCFNNGKNLEHALTLWSIENSLMKNGGGWGYRRLALILWGEGGGDGRRLTQLDTDIAEHFMLYLASDEGIRLLQILKKRSEKHFADERKKGYP